jgi:hypothetical protein
MNDLLKQKEITQKELSKKAGNDIRIYFDILKKTAAETEEKYHMKFKYQKLTKDKL